jgi:hypothetical protein
MILAAIGREFPGPAGFSRVPPMVEFFIGG